MLLKIFILKLSTKNINQKNFLFILFKIKDFSRSKTKSYLDVGSRYEKTFFRRNHNRERKKLEQNFTNC